MVLFGDHMKWLEIDPRRATSRLAPYTLYYHSVLFKEAIPFEGINM